MIKYEKYMAFSEKYFHINIDKHISQHYNEHVIKVRYCS